MILAFTGTRKGMTSRQLAKLRMLLDEFLPAHVYHGGAIGADAEFHAECVRRDVQLIEVFPSNLKHLSMSVIDLPVTGALKVHPPQPPLDRNWVIARHAELLIACPAESIETVRSGTWTTVRYADRLNKRIIVIKPQEDAVGPDGALQE